MIIHTRFLRLDYILHDLYRHSPHGTLAKMLSVSFLLRLRSVISVLNSMISFLPFQLQSSDTMDKARPVSGISTS
jgi:hypothetical protein